MGYLRRPALFKISGMPPRAIARQFPNEVDGEMTPMRNVRLLTNLLNDDSGQDLIEYALVAALVALSAIGAMTALTNKINNEFNKVGNSL
jgi:pilus assembly protein Flp/PilA